MRVLILIVAIAMIGCGSKVDISMGEISSSLAKRFKVTSDNISVTDIGLERFYEVSLSTGEVFYTDVRGENLIIGRLINKDNQDLTAKKEDEFSRVKVAGIMEILELNKAIKMSDGKIKVIEFTDVDCPFCFKAEGFFKDRDVSRYIYFTPLDELHPEAEKKSIHILCSDNKTLEYERVINNKVSEYKSCDEGIVLLKEHRAFGKLVGVTGTPHFIINGKMIIGADPKILDEIEGR